MSVILWIIALGTERIVILSSDIWSYLLGVNVLFCSFCCPPWVLGEYCNCVLCDRKYFWDPDGCVCWGFQVKYVSRYWELIHRNGDLVEVGLRSSRGSREKRGFHQDLLSQLGMWTEAEERPQQMIYYRTGNKT